MEKFLKQNWFKVTILIIGVLIVVFLFKNNKAETKTDFNLNVPKTTDSIQTQQTDVVSNKLENGCIQKANIFFHSLKMPNYSVTSHYSEELNGCFFAIQNESNDTIVMRKLYSESGEILGTYDEILPTGDATLCNALIPHKEPAKFGCTAGAVDLSSNISYTDWENFIKTYMQN